MLCGETHIGVARFYWWWAFCFPLLDIKAMTTQNTEKSKKKYGIKHLILGLVIFTFFTIVFGLLSGGSSENSPSSQTQQKSDDSFFEKTKEVFQSPEERLGCEDEKIENLNNDELAESKKVVKITILNTNIVEYPLSKKEVMREYCVRVANLTSNVGDAKILVQFLDKDNNVLVEKEDYAFDIPGKRAKTIYGSVFIETQLSKEVSTIRVSYIK